MSVNPIPENFNTVTSYLVFKDTQQALDFYGEVFGAVVETCMKGPDGKSTVHAEMRIGNSNVMLTDENLDWGMKSVATLGGSPVSMHVYVEDVDAVVARCVKAGCKVVAEVEDQFWGDRMGKIEDPFGFQWGIASRKEELSNEEIARRGEEWMKQMAGG